MILPLKSLEDFYDKLVNHNNDRFRSFEHCFLFFNGLSSNLNNEDAERAMLHLGFYLASWGMYRGSSFLLQKDYMIYEPIVLKLLNSKYSILKELDEVLVEDNLNELSMLAFSLHEDLQGLFEIERTSYYNFIKVDHPQQSISSVLTTKVMMGTLGCIPAYDRYFKSGIKVFNQTNDANKLIQTFSKNSIMKIYKFLLENKSELLGIQKSIKKRTNVKYPFLKLIDSYFWLIGFEEDNNND